MSGGRLVVLDRLGREVKKYPLLSGLATLGSDPRCDIRVMLPTVSGHHATVVVHTNQTVVRNVGDGETLVNGVTVSVAALRHGDLITVGDRSLRWEYADPAGRRAPPPQPTLQGAARAGGARARSRRAGSGGAAPAARDPALRLALEMRHRASMPGNAGGKQVAIVQPQRRDTTEQNEPGGAGGAHTTKAEQWIQSRKTSPRRAALAHAHAHALAHTPKVYTSRKPAVSAKKSTPLRMFVLRRAQSAHKARVTKIEAPTAIDHTKRAAIMLMTGHTPKSKLPSPKTSSGKKTPSYVIKKPSPVRRTPRGPRGSKTPTVTPKTRVTPTNSVAPDTSAPAKANSTTKAGASSRTSRAAPTSPNSAAATRSSKRGSASKTISMAEARSSQASPARSPRKSALRDPAARRDRKNDSIKFDLSNLRARDIHHEVHSLGDTTKGTYDDSITEDEITLRYSDTSSVQSPSPRKSIHSRTSKILEKSLGTSLSESPTLQKSTRSTLTAATPDSPRRKSNRGSLIIQRALETSDSSRYSRRTTKTLTEHSAASSAAAACRTRTLSPRSPAQNLETYSIVDLVSIDSNESGRSASVYNSAGSANSSAIAFGTPQNSTGRKTRSTIDLGNLIGSSTPYVGKTTRNSSMRSQNSSKSSINDSRKSNKSSGSSRRSKSLSTPENTQNHFSVNSTRISRTSKSRSRIGDSDLLLISLSDNSQVEDESPRSSRRVSRSSQPIPTSPVVARKTRSNQASPVISRTTKSNQASPVISRKTISVNQSPAPKHKSARRSGGDSTPSSNEGMSTPENRHSPQEVGTPVLSIQSLLDSSQSSLTSRSSKKGRASINIKRKTIGAIRSEPRGRTGIKSKSLNFTARKGLLRLSGDSDKTDEGVSKTSNEKMVTPKSAVKLVQEAVKNKHSTAKKPLSKRSIIDNLDESDIVKQLFNSPVKRKLSQSMTEFSRKQLFDDEDVAPRRPTRNTIAVAGRTPDNSLLDHTQAFTPGVFVSPISTPSNSPNLIGIKRLFRKDTPDNDLRDVRGVKALLRSPRTRRSIKNDLTNVSGVKQVFAKSPKNRLSDVRVKKVFVASPKNDLRRVSGVKSLFQTQKKRKSPRNDLTDVAGVRNLFKRKSPPNDLRRVSGVKRTLRRNSPRNDLSDVRGVKRMFGRQREGNDLNDVSGVEVLFDESDRSARDAEGPFDRPVGRPPVRAVYSKSFVKKPPQKPRTRSARSLHASIDVITSNVEDWLERELQKRLQRPEDGAPRQPQAPAARAAGSLGGRKSAAELYSAHTLPLKKRSLAEGSAHASGARLPLKKRAVAHSTPVKGRPRGARPASGLGRVSPIALTDTSLRSEPSTLPMTDALMDKGKRVSKVAVEIVNASASAARSSSRAKPSNEDEPSPEPSKSSPRTTKKPSPKTTITESSPKTLRTKKSSRTAKSSSRTKPSPKTTRSTPITTKSSSRTTKSFSRTTKSSPEPSKPSPKVTKFTPEKTKRLPKEIASQGKNEASPPQRSTRARGNKTDTSRTNTKKRRTSLVIAKKSPVMSPKPAPRTRRGKVEDTSTKTAPVEVAKATPKKTRASRKQEEKPATPKRNTRAKVQKASVVVSKPSPQLKPQAKTRAKADNEAKVEEAPKTRAKRESKAKVETETQRRPRKTTASEKTIEEVESKTKRRKVESPKESPRKTRRNNAAENEPKGRKNKADKSKSKDEVTKSPVKKRGRVTQQEPEKAEPKRSTRKTQVRDDAKASKSEVQPATTEKNVKEAPKATRSRKAVETQASTQSEPAARGRATKRKSATGGAAPAKLAKLADDRPGKGRKAVSPARAPAAVAKGPAKGRKETAKDTVPKTNSRKKKTEEEVKPVKQASSKKSPGAPRTRTAPPARGKAEPAIVATKTTGRSRRR